MKCDNLSPDIFYQNMYWCLLNNIFQNQRWKMIALKDISKKTPQKVANLIILYGMEYIQFKSLLANCAMVCFGLLAWSKMYKYQHPKLFRNLGNGLNIFVVYNWTLHFWKCWSNIKMHFFCIIAFKVKKCNLKNFKICLKLP